MKHYHIFAYFFIGKVGHDLWLLFAGVYSVHVHVPGVLAPGVCRRSVPPQCRQKEVTTFLPVLEELDQ